MENTPKYVTETKQEDETVTSNGTGGSSTDTNGAPPPTDSSHHSGRGSGLNLKDLRTFTSFKNPVFRLYYGAMMGQMAAMNMQMVARSLLVYELTGSGTALGTMALGNAMPMLFFSLFG